MSNPLIKNKIKLKWLSTFPVVVCWLLPQYFNILKHRGIVVFLQATRNEEEIEHPATIPRKIGHGSIPEGRGQ